MSIKEVAAKRRRFSSWLSEPADRLTPRRISLNAVFMLVSSPGSSRTFRRLASRHIAGGSRPAEQAPDGRSWPGALVLPPDLQVRAPPAQRDLDFDDEPGECGRHQVEATHDQAREDEYASRDRRGGDAITAVGEPHRLQHSDADQDDQPAHDVDPASAAASDERHGESDQGDEPRHRADQRRPVAVHHRSPLIRRLRRRLRARSLAHRAGARRLHRAAIPARNTSSRSPAANASDTSRIPAHTPGITPVPMRVTATSATSRRTASIAGSRKSTPYELSLIHISE